jgi:hypothetical protein
VTEPSETETREVKVWAGRVISNRKEIESLTAQGFPLKDATQTRLEDGSWSTTLPPIEGGPPPVYATPDPGSVRTGAEAQADAEAAVRAAEQRASDGQTAGQTATDARADASPSTSEAAESAGADAPTSRRGRKN